MTLSDAGETPMPECPGRDPDNVMIVSRQVGARVRLVLASGWFASGWVTADELRGAARPAVGPDLPNRPRGDVAGGEHREGAVDV